MGIRLGAQSGLIAEGGRAGLFAIIASCLGVGVGLLGLPLMTIGIFVAPLHREFAWSRYEIASVTLCINAATLLAAPVMGRICDKIGVRPVAIFSVVFLAVGYFCLSVMQGSLKYYYLVWILTSIGGVGTSGIVWSKAVSSWYTAHRGLALGITMTGTALAAIFGPLLLSILVQAEGWRAGYRALGIVTLLLTPVVYAMLSERRSDDVVALEGAPPPSHGFDLREAIGRASFWKLGAGLFFVVGGMGSMIVYFVPLATDRGLTPTVAAIIYSILGLTMLLARIGVGWALDRFSATAIAGLIFSMPAIACLLLSMGLNGVWVFVLSAAILGLCAGAEINLLAYMTARYFGMRAYAAIYGCELAFFAAGSGVGAALTGYSRDLTGSYETALRVGIATFLLGAALVASMGRIPAAFPQSDRALAPG